VAVVDATSGATAGARPHLISHLHTSRDRTPSAPDVLVGDSYNGPVSDRTPSAPDVLVGDSYNGPVSGVSTSRKRSPETFGPYAVYEELGRGGMAIVHRAVPRENTSRGPIALKRLLPHSPEELDLVRAFIEEAQLATRFDHPNIARTYSIGRSGGAYFIAMEYVPGSTLLELIKHCSAIGLAVPVPVVVKVLIEICDALDHVHQARDRAGNPLAIVHRDVTLSNAIISSKGLVKLIDFGIAKSRSSQYRTEAGVIKGKFGYLAPEYIAGHIDQRADLWAVGVVAHELLAGRRLFQGKNDLDTITRLREMEIECPSRLRDDVPAELGAIVMTALERDLSRRWQSAHALHVALVEFAREHGELSGAKLHEWVEWALAQQALSEDSITAAVSVVPGLDDMTDVRVDLDSIDDVDVDRIMSSELPADPTDGFTIRFDAPAATTPGELLPASPRTISGAITARVPVAPPVEDEPSVPIDDTSQPIDERSEPVIAPAPAAAPPTSRAALWIAAPLLVLALAAAIAVLYYGGWLVASA
jgi:serine/threonine protein kinase